MAYWPLAKPSPVTPYPQALSRLALKTLRASKYFIVFFVAYHASGELFFQCSGSAQFFAYFVPAITIVFRDIFKWEFRIAQVRTLASR
jgi:hypothetical protein